MGRRLTNILFGIDFFEETPSTSWGEAMYEVKYILSECGCQVSRMYDMDNCS